MKIRFGYAVLSKTLEDQKLFRSLTYTNYLKEESDDKLKNIIDYNIEGLREILKYNVKNNIHFYRLSSSFIPLATHKDVKFNYQDYLFDKLLEIKNIINNNNIRIDTHPDQYCVLNSTKKDVVLSSIDILNYEYTVLKMLNIKEPTIILHIGSKEGGKEASIKRFIQNFNCLNEPVKKAIVLENDDKVYTALDTLKLCQTLDIPMCLDYHHYICNNDNENIGHYLEDIYKTWKNRTPKMHYSSPKNKTKKDMRSHHDYINVEEFIKFLNVIKEFNHDVDIMIEAKMKDEALFRLTRSLKYLTNYKFIDDTTLII